MSEQQYRVIADRDKGDVPTWNDVEVGDLVVSRTTPHPQHGGAMVNGVDMLVRVERPVPTEHCLGTHYHDSHLWTGKPGTHYWCKGYAAPDETLPTREQIIDAITCGNSHSVCDFEAEIADRVLTLLQKGAD